MCGYAFLALLVRATPCFRWLPASCSCLMLRNDHDDDDYDDDDFLVFISIFYIYLFFVQYFACNFFMSLPPLYILFWEILALTPFYTRICQCISLSLCICVCRFLHASTTHCRWFFICLLLLQAHCAQVCWNILNIHSTLLVKRTQNRKSSCKYFTLCSTRCPAFSLPASCLARNLPFCFDDYFILCYFYL